MTDPADRVAVIVATRDAERFVADALASIVAQDTPELDLIVVDAASRDRTCRIVREVTPEAVLLHQTGSGLWQAWNQAIRATSAPLITFLDSDDRWAAGAVAAHLRALREHPTALASVGQTRFELVGDTVPPGIRPELLTGVHRGPIPGASMLRRAAFEQVGLFPEDVPTAADIEWFARLRAGGAAVAEPAAVVLHKRLSGDSLGARFARQGQYDTDLIRVARASLQRRRAGQAPP